jgi:hypothetical protein
MIKAFIVEWLSNVLPETCPFARDVKVYGFVLFTIPPLCKFNPFFEDIQNHREKRFRLILNCEIVDSSACAPIFRKSRRSYFFPRNMFLLTKS